MAFPSSYSAFAHKDFRLFQAGKFLAILASQMQGVAVGWQVYARTGRPLDLGYVGLAQFLPAVLLSLVTGHTADRFDRRKIVLVCHAALALCSVALFVLAMAPLPSVWPVYAVLALVGTARAFNAPASQSLLPHLVPEAEFPGAVAWSSSIAQAGFAVGPALGGLSIEWTRDASYVYAVCAAMSATALVLVLVMRAATGRLEHRATSWKTLLAGVEYVWEKKILLGAISLDLFAVLLGGATALLPMFAKDILVVGPLGFGVLRCAPAVGAMVMAIFLAHHPVRRRAGVIMFACVAVFGAATIAFGASESFSLSIAALIVIGASDMVSVFVRQTLVQLATPAEMRGRVSAVNMVFIGASNELGEFESGVTAEWLGAARAVIAGGVGTLVVVAVWSGLFPALRQVDSLTEKRA